MIRPNSLINHFCFALTFHGSPLPHLGQLVASEAIEEPQTPQGTSAIMSFRYWLMMLVAYYKGH